MCSDTPHQPPIPKTRCSVPNSIRGPPCHGSVCTDEDYAHIFSWPRQETTKQPFFNVLASEVENLEEKDFQPVRNKAAKPLSGIQNKAEEMTFQP